MTHTQYQIDELDTLKWVAPTYHDIKWPERQSLPGPHKEIDSNEFLTKMFANSHSLKGIYYSQLFLSNNSQEDPYKDGFPTDIPLCEVNFYWYPDYGLAVAKWHTSESRRIWPDKFWVPKNSNYGYEFRFFLVGCEHEYSHESPRMFDHKYTCKKCGYSYWVDSSG